MGLSLCCLLYSEEDYAGSKIKLELTSSNKYYRAWQSGQHNPEEDLPFSPRSIKCTHDTGFYLTQTDPYYTYAEMDYDHQFKSPALPNYNYDTFELYFRSN